MFFEYEQAVTMGGGLVAKAILQMPNEVRLLKFAILYEWTLCNIEFDWLRGLHLVVVSIVAVVLLKNILRLYPDLPNGGLH